MRGVTCSAPITVRFHACIGGRPIARPSPNGNPPRCGRSFRSVILSRSRYIVILDISRAYPVQARTLAEPQCWGGPQLLSPGRSYTLSPSGPEVVDTLADLRSRVSQSRD